MRSQLNPRICFRVREHRDVDLILGQGMLNAGWHAHTSTPRQVPHLGTGARHARRARAYLVTDRDIAETAAWHSASRPKLDEVLRGAI